MIVGPSYLRVLQYCHDSPLAGHFGTQKTLELVTRKYWWPHLREFFMDYVHTCDVCCRSKIPRHRPYGLLQPLPIPIGPWKSISMDFITNLPISKGYHAILTMVDRLTKMAHFLPCVKNFTSQDTTNIVTQEVFKLHGLPDDSISDRGPFQSSDGSKLANTEFGTWCSVFLGICEFLPQIHQELFEDCDSSYRAYSEGQVIYMGY